MVTRLVVLWLVLAVMAGCATRERPPTATLYVSYTPNEALVTVWKWSPVVPRGEEVEPRGDEIRVQSRMLVYDLLPGTYLVEVMLSGYHEDYRWVAVGPGDVVHESFELEPRE